MSTKQYPEDLPPGKHMYVFRPGEASRNQPRWQFGLEEDGRCGVILTYPISGLPWRHTRKKAINFQLTQADAMALFNEIATLGAEFPQECLGNEQLWADTTERGNSITRDKDSNSLCITLGIMERGQWTLYYALREDSHVLRDSRFYRVIMELISPYTSEQN